MNDGFSKKEAYTQRMRFNEKLATATVLVIGNSWTDISRTATQAAWATESMPKGFDLCLKSSYFNIQLTKPLRL